MEYPASLLRRLVPGLGFVGIETDYEEGLETVLYTVEPGSSSDTLGTSLPWNLSGFLVFLWVL